MDSTDARLGLLEAHVLAQQNERVDVQRLNDSVERLGLVAAELGKVLTNLGQEIRDVDTKTSEDLARGSLQRIITGVVVVILAVVGTGGGVALREAQQDDGYANCLESQRNAFAVNAYLEAVVKNSTNVELAQTAQDLIDNYGIPSDCEAP